MTTIELESRRQLIVESLAQLDSVEALAKVQNYIKNLQKRKEVAPPPCQYTVEEVKERLNAAMEAIKSGRPGHTAEEVRQMIESWK